MKLHDYLDIEKLEEQIAEGYVNRNFHKKFTNLAIYTYSRQCTTAYAWNDITCKCRGLIVDTSTWDIIARPFEKFFNLGEAAFPEYSRDNLPKEQPYITDKLDGNLITLYQWRGTWYAASKGSFHSDYADWANNWLQKNGARAPLGTTPNQWPQGYTPVFEMIAEELEHHVVHYGKEASGLYLIALINNETGEELNIVSKAVWASVNDVPLIPLLDITLEKALTDNEKNAEGYVLAWPRPGQTPLRVKVKFIDFLRLQKLVHHIGPKEILDYMTQPHLQCYLDEVLNPETSHPEFIKYARAWMDRFNLHYWLIDVQCNNTLGDLFKVLTLESPRKDWAEKIRATEYPAILFAALDYRLAMLRADWAAEKNDAHRARINKLIWKQVEPIAAQQDDVRSLRSLITQEE